MYYKQYIARDLRKCKHSFVGLSFGVSSVEQPEKDATELVQLNCTLRWQRRVTHYQSAGGQRLTWREVRTFLLVQLAGPNWTVSLPVSRWFSKEERFARDVGCA
jgi:hypothetical protein